MHTVHSDVKLARACLVKCPHCLIDGPQARFLEHVEAEHPAVRSQGRISSFTVGIPERFRPLLQEFQQATGWSYGQLVAAALDGHYGRRGEDMKFRRL